METRNGDMSWCLWKDCSTPCCKSKDKVTFDEEKGYFFQNKNGEIKYEWPKTSYFTTLTQEEKDKLKETSVKVETHPVLAKFSYDPINQEIEYETRQIHALSDCLWASWCKLWDNRPSVCKAYPFTHHDKRPLDTACPEAWEIVKHENNIINAIKTIIWAWLPIHLEEYVDEIIDILESENIQVPRTKKWILDTLNNIQP